MFAALIKRETEKEKRTEQNDVIIELNPLVVSLHLGSMKIFFNNIKTEEKTADGEYLGELDQVRYFLFLNYLLTYIQFIFPNSIKKSGCHILGLLFHFEKITFYAKKS